MVGISRDPIKIFETDSFIPKSDEAIKFDDLTEMKNHFRLFDYILDIIDEELTKENIIEMNKILKEIQQMKRIQDIMLENLKLFQIKLV